MKALVLIGIIFLSVSCRKAPARSERVTDSVRVEVRTREVPVFIPGDSVTVRDSVPCPDMNLSAKSDRTRVDVKIKDNQLSATATCPDFNTTAPVQDSIIQQSRKEIITVTDSCVTPWYDIACRYALGCTLLIILLYKR